MKKKKKPENRLESRIVQSKHNQSYVLESYPIFKRNIKPKGIESQILSDDGEGSWKTLLLLPLTKISVNLFSFGGKHFEQFLSSIKNHVASKRFPLIQIK